MKVALLFDDVDRRPHATADERGVLEAAGAVEDALVSLRHRVTRVPVGGDPADWLERLTAVRADLVFNLCEGVNGSSAHEPHAAALVELLGLPATGCTAETLALARRKDRVNAILAAAGMAVPAWTALRPEDTLRGWTRFPAIVKPAGEDASVGITQASVAREPRALEHAVAAARRHGTVLIQEFIAGRELNAGIVAGEVLPLAEIDFDALPDAAWPIVSYAAKWETGSAEDLGTRPVCPARLDPALATRIRASAHAAWQCIGGAGYGRVDFRVAADGTAYVLEVNPNPDLAPGAGLARMASARGWSYTELIARIVSAAADRSRVAAAAQQAGALG